MLSPIPGSHRLFSAVQTALGGEAERLPLVIGIDGRWGAGKSSAASWLGWQLNIPVIALDLYVPATANVLRGDTRSWLARWRRARGRAAR